MSTLVYGIVSEAATPLRSEPSHRSEMVSQLLFGEPIRLLESSDEWSLIALLHDGYQGWVTRTSLLLSGEPPPPTLLQSHRVLSPTATALQQGAAAPITLPMGALLASYDEEQHTFLLGDRCYTLLSGEVKYPIYTTPQAIIATAKGCLHTPYLWGGRTVMGTDCSGFVQLCFALHGISLLRDAKQQAEQGIAVASLAEAEAGDIALFANDNGAITHVGILLHTAAIIHASGRVRIDSIDATGIYNNELQKYTHRLHTIRRVI